ncbi:hypothetical protein [Sinorhizobium sp. RAC02]|uniref:hypothetical protein n=1 Tax=Sinorhizobium sp. RAC02 TaxID=1842534 RepID=UPI000856FE10|nr:hypothetical protein [Sinorhizobium sp. RAC02]AOF88836.1 hypothetical protein BSY16_514 [Sinorhizobium sp. RAC02]
MGRKPEDYAQLLASALCKIHAAECRDVSPLMSDDSVRIISQTIAVAMEDARKIQIEQELAAIRERRERIHLHS